MVMPRTQRPVRVSRKKVVVDVGDTYSRVLSRQAVNNDDYQFVYQHRNPRPNIHSVINTFRQLVEISPQDLGL